MNYFSINFGRYWEQISQVLTVMAGITLAMILGVMFIKRTKALTRGGTISCWTDSNNIALVGSFCVFVTNLAFLGGTLQHVLFAVSLVVLELLPPWKLPPCLPVNTLFLTFLSFHFIYFFVALMLNLNCTGNTRKNATPAFENLVPTMCPKPKPGF